MAGPRKRDAAAFSRSLEAEPDGAELLAAAVGDVGRPPGRYPLPFDAEVLDAVEGGEPRADLAFHDVRQRAGCGREGHRDDGGPALKGDGADETEVNDVHAQVGVDDARQRRANGGLPS